MFDDLDWLRPNPNLQQLLGHYVAGSPEDGEAWQDRLMHLEGVEPQELVKCHGLLLAFGWIEQNTGNVPILRPGTVPGCYRVTSAGRRAFSSWCAVPTRKRRGQSQVPCRRSPKPSRRKSTGPAFRSAVASAVPRWRSRKRLRACLTRPENRLACPCPHRPAKNLRLV